MRRFLAAFGLVLLVACGDATAPAKPPKPDPYITVRVTDGLDTTKAPGRAQWRVYMLLSGPYTALNGIAFQGTYSMAILRGNHPLICMAVNADSVGQRLFAPLAIADTTTEAARDVAAYDSLVTRWYSGNHAALPSGFMLLTFLPTDAWNSEQYLAGHGLVRTDPIKWAWNWTDSDSTAFTERAATDTTACNQA